MEKTQAYTDRFIMHTELYMLLTGKHAQELSQQDMDRIEDLMSLQDKQPDGGINTTIHENQNQSMRPIVACNTTRGV